MTTTIFTRDDLDLIVTFAGCTLDEKPGSNWVQEAGGLPEYICRVARAVKRNGHTTSQAISIAVSRIKKWSAGLGVNADTQAKAAKALAQWEALKAKSHAKSAAKKVAASNVTSEILCLTAAVDFNVDAVRTAWEGRQRQVRREWFKAHPSDNYDTAPLTLYVRELWTRFIIVASDYGGKGDLFKVPYTVDTEGEVTFGDPVQVKTEYVTVGEDETPGSSLTDAELLALMEGKTASEDTEIEACALTRVIRAAATLAPLDQIMLSAASMKRSARTGMEEN